jgi:hypothetical protein
MTVDELGREQDKLLPTEDLAPYRGQWIALRGGRVVASDLDPIALRDNPDVRETDALMPVPAQEDTIFIL